MEFQKVCYLGRMKRLAPWSRGPMAFGAQGHLFLDVRQDLPTNPNREFAPPSHEGKAD